MLSAHCEAVVSTAANGVRLSCRAQQQPSKQQQHARDGEWAPSSSAAYTGMTSQERHLTTLSSSQVGPGSYQAPSSVKQARPSLAPFSTTATRGFEADTGRRSVSPGRASSPSGSARNGSAPRSRPDQAAADGGSSGAGTSTPSLFGKPQRHFYAPATSSFAGEADRFGSSATASPGWVGWQ